MKKRVWLVTVPRWCVYLGLHAILAVPPFSLDFVRKQYWTLFELNDVLWRFQISFSSHLSLKKFLQLFESCNKQWWTRTKHFVQDATVLTLFPNQRKFLSSDHRVYTVQACSDWVMVSLAQTLHPGSDTNRNFPYMGDIFCTSDSNRSPSKNKK